MVEIKQKSPQAAHDAVIEVQGRIWIYILHSNFLYIRFFCIFAAKWFSNSYDSDDQRPTPIIQSRRLYFFNHTMLDCSAGKGISRHTYTSSPFDVIVVKDCQSVVLKSLAQVVA